MDNSEIAVIGMSCRFNTADSVYALHRTLLRGKGCKCGDSGERVALMGYSGALGLDQRIAFINNIEYFDNDFFHITSQEAIRLSPELRIALELAVMAVLDGGYPPDSLKGTCCGVIASISGKGYREHCAEKDPLSNYGNSPSMAAGYIGHYLGVEGPVMMTDSDACTSSAGIMAAAELLRGGSADMMLVGGAELALFSDDEGAGTYMASLAPDNCCIPYSKKAGGTVTGESGGFILMKRLRDAVRDGDYIYGRLLGYSFGSAGLHSGSPYSPDCNVQLRIMKRAWENVGGVLPKEFEGGAIGIAASDKTEIAAFSELVEGEAICGSVRHAVGHNGHLCGLASVIRTMLSYKNNVAYPLGDYAAKGTIKANNLRFLESPVPMDEEKIRYTGINSFGVNGACVHIAAASYNENHKPNDNTDEDNCLVVLSAMSADLLTALMEQLEEYLVRSDADINDVIYTLNARRKLYPVRRAAFCKNRRELLDLLSACSKNVHADMNEVILLVEDKDNILAESAAGRFLESGLFTPYIAEYNDGNLIIYPSNDFNATVEYQDIAAPLIVSSYDNGLADLLLNNESYEETVKYCALHSARIHWNAYYRRKAYRNYPLPGYSFEKKRFWHRSFRKVQVMESISSSEAVQQRAVTAQKDTLSSNNEQKLMDVMRMLWKKHLELTEEIEYDDNFFELGGNSLTGGMALAELKELTGADIAFTDMYENPTIRAITQFYLKRTGS